MNRFVAFLCLLGAVLMAPTSLYADDTEIYFAQADASNEANEQTANVLFLIDTSGSMCDRPSGSRDCSRSDTKMYQLKQAFTQVVDGLSDGVRIGVGKFNGGYDNNGYGGYVFYPVSDMDATARQEVKNLVNGLQGTSNTPTMEAYSEMARYMMGLPPSDYAKRGEALENDPRLSVNVVYDNCATRDKWNRCKGGWVSQPYYSSPMNMDNQCETNHIIVMTDGDPTQDSDYSSARDLAGGWCNGSYTCQADLARWLMDDDRNSKGRSVRTWQVAFGVGAGSSQVTNMNNIASNGGTDTVRLADNADELAAEFNDILNLIAEDSQTITSPGVSVNQNNRLEHLDQFYYAMFKPEKTSVWPGNLKRYRLKDGEVVDANGNRAVDSDTGYFRETSKSYWTDGEPDGPDVRKGGARAELSGRKLVVGNVNGNGSYTLDAERLAQMTNSDFGIPRQGAEPAYDTKEEVYAALLTLWADPMHSVPLLVNYEVDSDGTDADDQTNYVFVSTNGGMLHAIDTENGNEKFAFMPDEMLKKAYDLVRSPPLKENNIRSLYGLDGSWVSYRTAKSNGDADEVHIYGGMRRGGNNYYALDVSDINNPRLEWRIRGAVEDNPATPGTEGPDSGFSRLGQTWSTPTPTRVRVGNTIKPVLVFGGGYSAEDHDTAGSRANKDAVGNAVYMVDAMTGERMWSIGTDDASTQVAEMKWSVPGGIAVVDLDFDGLADYLYFGDLGGQVFRVNIDNDGDSNTGLVEGVVRLASLGGAGAEDHRRFYEAPAVGYRRAGVTETLYVAIGSGYRAHPLDEQTEEGFFLLADKNFRSTEQPSSVLTLSDLPDVAGANPPTLDESGDGWRVAFTQAGEKVMSSPSIFQGGVMFSTYKPSDVDQDADPCVVRYGNAYAYHADMLTGEPRAFNNDGNVPSWDDPEPIGNTIPPSLVPIFLGNPGSDNPDEEDPSGDPNSNKVVICSGAICLGDFQPRYPMFRKHRWYPMKKNDANEYFPPAQETEQ
ncbi:PilC/PilY family type IV pilus protein [Alloalcanivorax marinus]|uniref:PilC/PilY family type IV pilus protein n=1 Tax=Alloalcanivorax marinus TaxID=1177169 RepID=UPI0021D04525|nr:PilC/PilY family type IV pilus protein [Alloalcanivorax marinus]